MTQATFKNLLAPAPGIIVNARSEGKILRENPRVTKQSPEPSDFSSTKPKSNRKSRLVMKPIIPFALLGALFAVGAVKAASTTPVGYVSLGDAGTVAPNTDVYVSIPLLKPSAFNGAIASISGNEITISGTPSLASLSDPSNPHVLVIENGSKSGLIGLVTSNTSTTVTVSPQPNESLAGITAGTTFSIRPAWTVAGFLGAGLPSGTQLLGFSGAFAGVNPSADLVYEFDGANWVDVVSFDTADNVVIYPNETFILRNVSGSPINGLTVAGEVSTANSRTVITNNAVTGQDNVLTYFGSTDEFIGNSGLSSVAEAGDQIFAYDNAAPGFNKSSSLVVEYDGSAWIDVVTFDDVSSVFKFESGKGYALRRVASSSLAPTVWSDQPNYVPGL